MFVTTSRFARQETYACIQGPHRRCPRPVFQNYFEYLIICLHSPIGLQNKPKLVKHALIPLTCNIFSITCTLSPVNYSDTLTYFVGEKRVCTFHGGSSTSCLGITVSGIAISTLKSIIKICIVHDMNFSQYASPSFGISG